MTLLTGQRRREWSNFYASGQWFLFSIEPLYLYASRSYTLLAANKPLSDLAPWQQTRNVDDVANQGSISPRPPRNPQYPNFPTHELPSNPTSTFNIVYPDGFPNSRGSSLEPLYGGSRSLSSSGDYHRNHLFSITHSMRTAIYIDHSVDKIRNPGIPDQLRHGYGTLYGCFPSLGDRLMSLCHDVTRPKRCTKGSSTAVYIW